MKFRKFRAVCFLPLVILGLLTACEARYVAPQIEYVPDTAVSVRVIDLRYLLKAAGLEGQLRGGGMDEPVETLFGLCLPAELRNLCLSVGMVNGGLDLASIYGFTTASGHEVMVVPVDNQSVLVNGLLRNSDAQEIKPADREWKLRYFSMPDGIAAIGMGYCWLAVEEATVSEALREAAAGNMGAMTGLRQFFDNPSQVKLAFNCAMSPLDFLGGRDKWLCVNFDVFDTAVSSDAVVMDGEGNVDMLGENFSEIDTTFLRYTPADASVVLAYGKFGGNVRGLSMLLGRFAPVYLAQADGTTSLYALPASGNVESVRDAVAGAWNVETMVQVPQDVMIAGLGSYRREAPGARYLGDQWAYADGDATYYFGGFDGALVFSSNREISDGYHNDFHDDFAGKRALMLINVPYGSVLAKAWNLPYGVHCKIGVDQRRAFARITFSGTNEPALLSLLRLPQIHDLKARFDANVGR